MNVEELENSSISDFLLTAALTGSWALVIAVGVKAVRPRLARIMSNIKADYLFLHPSESGRQVSYLVMFFRGSVEYHVSQGLELARDDIVTPIEDRIKPQRSRKTQMIRLICRSILVKWRAVKRWYADHAGQRN